MGSDAIVLPYSDFVARYRPISAEIVEGEPDRKMFAAFGRDLERVRRTNGFFVWTVVDVELDGEGELPYDGEFGDNCWLIVPGYHLVNRLSYMITEVPWDDDRLEIVY